MLAVLMNCPVLTRLSVMGIRSLTDAAFQHPSSGLAGLKNLKYLGISGCPKLTIETIKSLGRDCKNLNYLVAVRCPEIAKFRVEELMLLFSTSVFLEIELELQVYSVTNKNKH